MNFDQKVASAILTRCFGIEGVLLIWFVLEPKQAIPLRLLLRRRMVNVISLRYRLYVLWHHLAHDFKQSTRLYWQARNNNYNSWAA